MSFKSIVNGQTTDKTDQKNSPCPYVTGELTNQELHQCQTVWIQIRTDILLGLIWVQTVCKSHRQMTLGDKEYNMVIDAITLNRALII